MRYLNLRNAFAILAALAVMLIAPIRANSAKYSDFQHEATKEEYCYVWAHNAVLGGAAALRGKARKIIPVEDGSVGEMLEHYLQLDGIFVFASTMREPRHADFVTESVFAGYDYVIDMKKAGREDRLPSSAEQAHKVFFTGCMSKEDV